jgi:hypothetical protein
MMHMYGTRAPLGKFCCVVSAGLCLRSSSSNLVRSSSAPSNVCCALEWAVYCTPSRAISVVQGCARALHDTVNVGGADYSALK